MDFTCNYYTISHMGKPFEAQRKDENFPVAAWSFSARRRRLLLAFYRYARGLDNIADNDHTPANMKQAELRAIHTALQDHRPDTLPEWAQPYAHAVAAGEINPVYGEQLWHAFWQDSHQQRYDTWEALLDYCRLSAAPVGRFLLDLYAEPQPDRAACDALCAALQIINHLQDLRADKRRLNRIYLPQRWMRRHQASEAMIDADTLSPQLRCAVQEVIERNAVLLQQADALPASLRHRGLRWQSRYVLAIAARLLEKLRREDMLATRITLTRKDYIRLLGRTL